MNGARSRLRNEKKLARKADRLARSVFKSLQTDRQLRRLGVRFLKKGERLSVQDVESVRAYWVSVGGHIESSELRTTEPVKDIVGIHVSASIDEMNYKDTWRNLTEIAYERFRDEILSRIRTQFSINPSYLGSLRRKVHFGVWLSEARVFSYFEDDNWYFHVGIRLSVGGMVV